ncbi:MAG: type II toxin-antitoxin system VapC family toxin [Sulfobacillus sp.]
MILYLDTSALIKLYVSEEGSSLVSEAVNSAERVATSRVAYAEARAALAMAARLGRITETERATAVAVFRADWRLYSVVNVSQPLVELAAELAEAKGLRGFDAIHLASSILIMQGTVEPVCFMAYDRALLLAASDMGLTVRGPGH